MDDSRHDATMAALGPAIAAAKVVLVEAGPEEIAALQSRLARDPALMVRVEGPTLPQRLTPEMWDKLAGARGAALYGGQVAALVSVDDPVDPALCLGGYGRGSRP